MNNQRRAVLRNMSKQLDSLSQMHSKKDVMEIVNALPDIAFGLKDEENDAYDNLPQSLQLSDMGGRIDECIWILDDLGCILEALQEMFEWQERLSVKAGSVMIAEAKEAIEKAIAL